MGALKNKRKESNPTGRGEGVGGEEDTELCIMERLGERTKEMKSPL